MSKTVLSQPTIGAYLERARLERRAAKMESVLSTLRLRAREYAAAAGSVPRPLRLAIDDFDAELSALRGRLGRHGR
jgi:hypothetical protein